jgi:hypothetical protein
MVISRVKPRSANAASSRLHHLAYVISGSRHNETVHDRTLRQRESPTDHLARVDAGLRALGLGCTLLGALAGGALAEAIGTRAMLFASSAVIAAAALTAWAALPRARALTVV